MTFGDDFGRSKTVQGGHAMNTNEVGYEPTPDEIAATMNEIRRGWTREEQLSRGNLTDDRSVRNAKKTVRKSGRPRRVAGKN